MSYKTYSFIVKEENNVSDLKKEIIDNFKFHNVREIYTPFKGVVCQTHESYKSLPFEKFSGNIFKNQDEVKEYFENYTENHLIQFSKKYPDNKFAFIEVDCLGGKCFSEGYIIKDGERIFAKEPHHSSHMLLLNNIEPDYKSWFFYPFTRTFFKDKGGINGEIIDFSMAGVWMAINSEFGNDNNYEISFSENEMQFLNESKFELYFMKITDERIKVMGTLYSIEKENIDFVKNLIEEAFSGMKYFFSLDNFETGENITIKTINENTLNEVIAKSYRMTAFNVRPFNFVSPSQTKSKSDSGEKKSTFSRLINKLLGK